MFPMIGKGWGPGGSVDEPDFRPPRAEVSTAMHAHTMGSIIQNAWWSINSNLLIVLLHFVFCEYYKKGLNCV